MQLLVLAAGFLLRPAVKQNQSLATNLLQPARTLCGAAGIEETGWV